MGLSRTFSEINGDFCRKSQFFPPGVFKAPAEGVALEFCNGGNTVKTSYFPPRWWKEFDDVCIRFDTITECDGQTDRRTYLRFATTISRSACIGVLTRIKADGYDRRIEGQAASKLINLWKL